ncbi:murein biosynthesis integral membrane protein MurJ [Bosea psychrotolerans]|uniref:Probable lipid II flippase MurJ n=1 Tax=Bosea psychrotolerans TaxID=1871628 RepID=A0A2S4M6Y2_9HYPH|nr:murein biosynthesis integral membrane protein MurJ [Bosea psychrotolerans]POR50484.1 putative peptidoglycan lipid II flippase [Bosea psychrotolerans]
MQKPAEGAPEPSRLARDSAIVGAATILSRLLGFARDVLIARLLGAGPVADAFLAALRLPNLVRRVLGEGGLNAPFVPLYLAVKAARGEEAARRFTGEAAGHLGLLLLGLVALGEIFAPWVVLGLAGGFAEEPQTLALAAHYTRLMLPFLLLTTLAAMLAAVLNAEKRFTLAALAPALMNALLVGFLLVSLARGLEAELAAQSQAVLVSLTGLAHLGLVLFALRKMFALHKTGLARPSLRWSPEMARLVRTGGATLLAASAAQLVLLVATQIASAEPGSVAALYYADRVFQLPLGFVGVAMGTVVLSEMADSAQASGPDARLGQALALGLALALPAALALFVLAEPIVSVLFEHGRFGAEDRARTAAALAGFALGLPFAVIAKVFGQVYFARQTPRLPLLAGCIAVLVAAMAGYALAGDGNAARMAACAASLAFLAQAVLLGVALLRDGIWRPSIANLRPIAASLAASAIMLGVLLILAFLLAARLAPTQSTPWRVAGLAALCAGGAFSYGAAGLLLGAFGTFSVPRYLRKRRA